VGCGKGGWYNSGEEWFFSHRTDVRLMLAGKVGAGGAAP
jgi:hypothetical protein